MMSLVEAFCRVNRARGLELVSPEDLMDACQNLESQRQSIRLVQLGDNVKVLQHVGFDEDHYAGMVLSLVCRLMANIFVSSLTTSKTNLTLRFCCIA